MAKGDKMMSQDELSFLCGQLAMMLRAGIPWPTGWTCSGRTSRTPPAGGCWSAWRRCWPAAAPSGRRRSGPGVFPPYMTGMVEVGEKAGRLEPGAGGPGRPLPREAPGAGIHPCRRGVSPGAGGDHGSGDGDSAGRGPAGIQPGVCQPGGPGLPGRHGRRVGGAGRHRGAAGSGGGVPASAAYRRPDPGLGPVLLALPLRPPGGGMPERRPLCLRGLPDAPERLRRPPGGGGWPPA